MLRRVQLMLDADLDDGLAREARAQRTSKSALVRRYLRERLKPLPPLREDPLWEWATSGPADVEPARHDDVVYPRD